MKYIISFILILSGCAPKPKGYEIPADFLPFVNSFAKAYGKPIPPVQIQFGETSDAAKCRISQDYSGRIIAREITVNTSYWRVVTDIYKKAIIWHELGHCVLMRSHTAPGSISYMRPTFSDVAFLGGESWFLQNESQMDRELFSF